MKSSDLKSFDLVDISFIRIKLAELVVLRPQTLTCDNLMKKKGNLKLAWAKQILSANCKYSALTAGSEIVIEVDGTELPLLVKETRAEGGLAVQGARIQDSNVKVDIDRSLLDKIVEELKEKEKDIKE